MKKFMLYLMFPCAAIGLTSCASSKNDSSRVAMEQNKKLDKKSRCDAKFAVFAYDVNNLGARLASLAETKATTPEIKQLGSTMNSEYQKSNAELKSAATKNNVVVPETLSERGQKAYDHFASIEGSKFDKAYARCLAKAQKKQICKYKKEAKKGNVADVKNYAAAEVPVLKKRKEMAELNCKLLKKK